MINETAKIKLQQFNADELMKQSVEEVLLSVCDLNEILAIKDEYSNSQIGQIDRAYRSARKLLKMGFKEIEKFKQENRETLSKIPAGL